MSAIVYSPTRYSLSPQLVIEHAQQALGFIGVALEGVGVVALVTRIFEKVSELTKHRTNVADLEKTAIADT